MRERIGRYHAYGRDILAGKRASKGVMYALGGATVADDRNVHSGSYIGSLGATADDFLEYVVDDHRGRVGFPSARPDQARAHRIFHRTRLVEHDDEAAWLVRRPPFCILRLLLHGFSPSG